MKFTKEQLSESLKAKLTPNGKKLAMSERTLNANVEKIYKRLEKSSNEEDLDDVVTEYLPDFEEINGNVQKDNSDFIKKWKEEHPDPKPNKAPEPNDGNEDKLDKLLKEIEGMKAEREAERTAKTISDKRSELLSKFKEKGIKDEKWLNGYIKKIAISKDTDIEAETNDALALYNLSQAETGKITPGNAGGGGEEKDEHIWDDIVQRNKRSRGDY